MKIDRLDDWPKLKQPTPLQLLARRVAATSLCTIVPVEKAKNDLSFAAKLDEFCQTSAPSPINAIKPCKIKTLIN